MKRKNGRFIIIDGIAGSGKTTIVEAAAAWAKACEHRTFHLNDWEKEHGQPPRFEDVSDFDIYFTYEPTRSWIGAGLRGELFRTDDPYGAVEIAQAFALDRHILYRRLILPALLAGKTIIQDRGVSSSIAYQPILAEGIDLEDLLKLPGNAFALQHAPDHLILTKIDPQLVHERLAKRGDESRGVFADVPYLTKVQERFHSEWYKKLFEANGAVVQTIETGVDREIMTQQAQKLIAEILISC